MRCLKEEFRVHSGELGQSANTWTGSEMPVRATDEARVSDVWNVYGGLISVEDPGSPINQATDTRQPPIINSPNSKAKI